MKAGENPDMRCIFMIHSAFGLKSSDTSSERLCCLKDSRPLYFSLSLYFLALAEAHETTKIHSVVGTLNGQAIIATRPFRSPHHTISDAGLVGGGTVPKPGDVSLAHNGVLFLAR